MTTHYFPLTEAFEFIADAGYIAHSEQIAQLSAVGTKCSKSKETLYRKFTLHEKKFSTKGKLIEIETIHSLLFPKLSAQD